MAILRPIPHPSVAFVDGEGRITPPWYEYFKSRERIGFANLSDVSATAPTNGQVPVYSTSTGKYEPGAN